MATLHLGPLRKRAYLEHPSDYWGDVLAAWLVATVTSALPSTLYAVVTGGDALEATRAAGTMLVPADSSLFRLLAAAALVHAGVSLFWAAVVTLLLPRKHVVWTAMIAAAGIAVLDLRILGQFFPAVYALPFWPQMADHLAWGASLGAMLAQRSRQRPPASRSFD